MPIVRGKSSAGPAEAAEGLGDHLGDRRCGTASNERGRERASVGSNRALGPIAHWTTGRRNWETDRRFRTPYGWSRLVRIKNPLLYPLSQRGVSLRSPVPSVIVGICGRWGPLRGLASFERLQKLDQGNPVLRVHLGQQMHNLRQGFSDSLLSAIRTAPWLRLRAVAVIASTYCLPESRLQSHLGRVHGFISNCQRAAAVGV